MTDEIKMVLISSTFTLLGVLSSAYFLHHKSPGQRAAQNADTQQTEVETMAIVNQTLRAHNVELEKKMIVARADLLDEHNRRVAVTREKNRYAAHALMLRALLKKHAPALELPEMEDSNGSEPEIKK